MPYYLVEYDLKPGETFEGHGGYSTKSGKILGITSALKSDYRIVTIGDNYDYEKEIFPLLYSLSTHINKDVEWDPYTGEVKLLDQSLEFRKMKKIMELNMKISFYLSQTDEIAMRIATMIAEGFDETEIEEEKVKHRDILEKRKRMKKNQAKIINIIKSCSSISELENIDLEELLNKEDL